MHAQCVYLFVVIISFCFYFSADENVDCLYSAASLVLFGDSYFKNELWQCIYKTRTGASHYINLMVKNLLERCEPATCALQSISLDISAAIETILYWFHWHKNFLWLKRLVSLNGSQAIVLSKWTDIMCFLIVYQIITKGVLLSLFLTYFHWCYC